MTDAPQTTQEASQLPAGSMAPNAAQTGLATRQGSELAPISEGPGALLSAIVGMARDPTVDVQKLQALMAMQERMEARQAEANFNRAFHAMEAELPRIKKNGDVEYKGQVAFKFAKWETIDASIRPILRRHGFSLSFDTAPRVGDGGGLVVTGSLLHVDGHHKSASISLALDSSGGKNNLQGGGSTFSYGCRYTARMLLNLVFEGDDDDGVRGGTKFITQDQALQIEALITEVKADRDAFMQHFQIANMLNLSVDDGTKAFNRLLSRVAPDRHKAWQEALEKGGIPK